MLKFAVPLGILLLAVPATVAAYTVRASYYGGSDKLCGRPMANGARLDCRSGVHTVAHRTLPFGTRLRVTYGGKTLENVVVTDRGPAKWTGRDLDLSYGAAKDLGMISSGVGHVQYEVVEMGRQVARSGRRAYRAVAEPTVNFFGNIFNAQPARVPDHAKGSRGHAPGLHRRGPPEGVHRGNPDVHPGVPEDLDRARVSS